MKDEHHIPVTHVIGILGGIGSGKSFVAELMKARGAVVLDADRVGHEVLREPQVESAARERWGDGIFNSDGHIDRKRLAKIVFAPPPDGPGELAHLEQLTHARIGERLQEQIAEIASREHPAALVLDAPVLLKAGWNQFCDKIVYVDAPHDVRLARVLARGWTEEELARREAAQEPLDVKRRLADLVIDNSGPAEATAAQMNVLWPQLIGKYA